ncbi:hypothetical protein EQO05_06620 [Methanosarcina sp. MSH10X1]|uniref:hypothetical protein n=1 Tax=Methanosarcina sp. MSH10X1 TaxID=2507075 RepID=UPI000FFB815A|nr:hypothetical protein [Methanosarcina sp. MSH10X1]RXA20243.1 hypothetical protein EQO05_06620 [Methanosarcina sp. MSH10X1]
MVEGPESYNESFIRKFTIFFCLISQVPDYLTFRFRFFLPESTKEFRSGWFMQAFISASSIVLVIRSRKPFFRSSPSIFSTGTVLIVALALVLPLVFLQHLLVSSLASTGNFSSLSHSRTVPLCG